MLEKRIRVDCHCHTDISFDGQITPQQMVRTTSRNGVDVVCVTDHNNIAGALEVIALNPPFRVIVGEEILTADGEMIALFVKERIRPKRPLSWTIDAIHEQGGLAVIPHPFCKVVMTRVTLPALYENIHKIDALEMINARNERVSDETAALRFARLFDKPMTAGSDGHLPHTLGRGYVLMAPFSGPEEFLSSLKTGTVVCERRTPLWLSGISFGFRLTIENGKKLLGKGKGQGLDD